MFTGLVQAVGQLQLELGRGQLTHQQEHQLLLLAFGKGSRKRFCPSAALQPMPAFHR